MSASNPNFVALGVALLFGLVTIPWSVTVRRLGAPEYFMVLGIMFFIVGLVSRRVLGAHGALSAAHLALGLGTALVYIAALSAASYVFGHPQVNLPVATAITAAYPLVTTIVMFLVMGQRLTIRETFFILMGVLCLGGLALSGKPQ